MYVFLNDKLVPGSEASVSVFDHGFLYGDGVYETMRSYKGIVFMLERHILRLRRSASLINLRIPEGAFIINAIRRTLDENSLSDAYIRVTVSRGPGPIGLDPGLCREPTFLVIAEQFIGHPDHMYKNGVKLIISKTRRNSRYALDPKIKSLNFLNNILAKIEAVQAGAHEALMLNTEGFLAEGTVSNVFFIRNGTLCTPSTEAGILDGITRELVIGVAEKRGIKVQQGLFCVDDLFNSSEVFYTNTTSEIMPASQVDDVYYRVGEISHALRRLYQEEVRNYKERP